MGTGHGNDSRHRRWISMEKVIVRLGPGAPQEIEGAAVAAGGSVETFRGSLQDVAARLDGRRLIVLVPGTQVLLTRVELPGGNRKRQLQAVPYALEESLAGEVERQHFVLGERQEDGAPAVAVVARELLEGWLAMLRQAGLEPAILAAETMALPVTTAGASLLVDNGLALVRTGRQSGFAIEVESLAVLLAGQELSGGLAVYGGPVPPLPAAMQEKVVAAPASAAGAMAVLAAGFDEKTAINLLQGLYSPHGQWQKLWGRWRLPACLAVAALLLAGMMELHHFFRLRSEHRLLAAEIEQVYREVFPEATKIVNPRAQMAHQLELLRGSQAAAGGFLPLMARTAPLLTATDGFRLQGLRYQGGKLDLDFGLQDLGVLDGLKSRLAAQGLAVDIRTAASQEGGVKARLQIGEGSP